ncbi:MAG: hypothetical protein RIT04_545 [Candidatus Parcubacteria bacterium]|jgi:hypothetical protein
MRHNPNDNRVQFSSLEKELELLTKIIINGQILEEKYHSSSEDKKTERWDASTNK